MLTVKVPACLALVRATFGFQLHLNSVQQWQDGSGSVSGAEQELDMMFEEHDVESQVTQMTRGCNWDCYLQRYPTLRNQKWEDEKGNLDYACNHFIRFGFAAGKDCKCDANITDQGSGILLAVKAADQGNDILLAGASIQESFETSEVDDTKESAEVAEMTKGCNWDCYIERYPALKNEKWEREHGNLDYARTHFIEHGYEAGKLCQCDADILAAYEADESADANQAQAGLEEPEQAQAGLEEPEQKEVDEEAADANFQHFLSTQAHPPNKLLLSLSQTTPQTQVELIKGCDWNCYLERYPAIRNAKWEEKHFGSLDYARDHYLKAGRVNGKDCTCEGSKKSQEAKSVAQPVSLGRWSHKSNQKKIDEVRLAELQEEQEDELYNKTLIEARLADAKAEVQKMEAKMEAAADAKKAEMEAAAQVDEAAQDAQESETVVQEETGVDQMLKSCDWNCYVDRYHMRNEKWETEHGNQDYARDHFINHGYAAGKDCQCDDDPHRAVIFMEEKSKSRKAGAEHAG